jgi:hypothetical protein
MARAGKHGYKNGLVDMATGQISREIFVNEAIYQQESEQVFTRAWLFIGHASQIPKPGDYFVSCMGEESVLLCRDREERIHKIGRLRQRTSTRPWCPSISGSAKSSGDGTGGTGDG